MLINLRFTTRFLIALIALSAISTSNHAMRRFVAPSPNLLVSKLSSAAALCSSKRHSSDQYGPKNISDAGKATKRFFEEQEIFLKHLPDETGALPIASGLGDANVVLERLELGVPIETKTQFLQATALHRAVEARNNTMVWLLLKRGADMSAANLLGDSALQYAVRMDDARIVQTISDHVIEVLSSLALRCNTPNEQELVVNTTKKFIDVYENASRMDSSQEIKNILIPTLATLKNFISFKDWPLEARKHSSGNYYLYATRHIKEKELFFKCPTILFEAAYIRYDDEFNTKIVHLGDTFGYVACRDIQEGDFIVHETRID